MQNGKKPVETVVLDILKVVLLIGVALIGFLFTICAMVLKMVKR